MNINIYNPYVRDELYHHGVLGQRKGVRNGPPYPLSASAHSAAEKKAGWRKSLNGGNTKKDKYGNLNDRSNNTGYKKQIDEMKNIIKSNDIISSNEATKLVRSGNPSDKKRVLSAADLGIKALDRMGRNLGDTDINNITGRDREWFIFEDQTIGLFSIADMVNRGKKKDMIKNTIERAKSMPYDYNNDDSLTSNQMGVIFELQESYEQDSFLNACYDIKADNRRK